MIWYCQVLYFFSSFVLTNAKGKLFSYVNDKTQPPFPRALPSFISSPFSLSFFWSPSLLLSFSLFSLSLLISPLLSSLLDILCFPLSFSPFFLSFFLPIPVLSFIPHLFLSLTLSFILSWSFSSPSLSHFISLSLPMKKKPVYFFCRRSMYIISTSRSISFVDVLCISSQQNARVVCMLVFYAFPIHCRPYIPRSAKKKKKKEARHKLRYLVL